MILPFFFSPPVHLCGCGSGRDEEPSGEKVLRLIQIRLTASSLEKIWPACQDNSAQAQTAVVVHRFTGLDVEQRAQTSLAASSALTLSVSLYFATSMSSASPSVVVSI